MSENSIGTGTILAGRFRLEDLLQETEGAHYWRATDQILARNVAVHVVAADDPRAGPLLAAARTSATVTDGHFLRVLDAAQEEAVAYVVNEWGAGSSLDTILADGPLSSRRAAWLVKEVAEAIAAAHRSGQAHGWLRPESVMVTEAGAVKVLGFAVDAALNGGAADPAGSDGSSSAAAAFRSDVAALASLLYATLVGRWPGEAESALPHAPQEHGRPLRPRRVRAGVPRPLDGICERVLNSGHHAGSVGTAREISAALNDFIGSPGAMAAEVDTTTTDIDPAEPSTDRSAPPDPPARPDDTPAQATATGRPGGPPWTSPATSDRKPPADPEETRAGAPLFFDDRTSVGWTSPDEPTTASEPVPRPLSPQPESRQGEGRSGSTQPPHGGAPPAPPAWGPDAQRAEDPGQPERWERRDAGKRWLALSALVAICLALAIVAIFVFNLGSDDPRRQRQVAQPTDSGQTSQSTAPPAPVTISAVSDFDPQGDPPEENSEEADLAIDGNPRTAWGTSTYFDPLELQKDGVGLLVDLGRPVEVSETSLKLAGSPTDLELFATGESSVVPASTAGLEMVASRVSAGTSVDLPLETPVTTRYLVVWLTSLPTVEGGFKGQIAEIVVRS